MKTILWIALLAGLWLPSGWSQAGMLDPSFGRGGWVHTDFGGKDQASAIAVQPDGKLLVGGRTNASGAFDFILARYTADGQLDTGFGNQGKLTWDFGSGQENIEYIKVLADGKILWGGYSNTNPNSHSIIMRLHPDGSPDSDFAAQGFVKYRFGRSTGPLECALQSDGKYVVSHLGVIDSFDVDWIIARFLPDGQLDSSFNQTGYRKHNFLTREDIPFHVQVLKDGKIFATGCAGVYPNVDFAFLRLHPDGSLDDSFGNGGSVQTDFYDNQDVAYGAVVLDDGRIMVSGTARDSLTNYDFGLARYLPDGQLDSSFGVNGKRSFDFKGPVDYGFYMIRQPDGKFLVNGINSILTKNSYVVARFFENGDLDTGFGTNGLAVMDVVNIAPDNTPKFTVQADGKILVVANYKDGTNINFLIARFLNDQTTHVGDPDAQPSLIQAYPNPFRDELILQIDPQVPNAPITLEICDGLGRILKTWTWNPLEQGYRIHLNESIKNMQGVVMLRWRSGLQTGTIPLFKG
ncbi:MAG TPA: hypothetical protein VFX48_09135 [Saprospiraceae bacterium]|nr:hypothetical protein [Saprospiraceae bacterium]